MMGMAGGRGRILSGQTREASLGKEGERRHKMSREGNNNSLDPRLRGRGEPENLCGTEIRPGGQPASWVWREKARDSQIMPLFSLDFMLGH